MRFILLALLSALSLGSPSEAAFEKTFGGPAVDRGVFVSPMKAGGYVSVGITRSSGEGDEDVYLVRTDGDGALLWSRTYGGPGEDMGWSVHQIPDGLIVAGSTGSFGSGGLDFYLVKAGVNGEAIWSKTYGGENDDLAWALLPASDGGFVLVGETQSSGAGEEDCLLVKTDAAGAEQWSHTYGGEKGDRCFAVAPTDDGGYMLAGQTYSEGEGDRDAYIVKTGPNGKLEWSKTFGGAASDVAHSIVPTSDGSFLVTGYTTSLAEEQDDPYLIKIDANGGTQWTSVLPIDGVNHTLTGAQANDGGFFLTGFTQIQSTKKALLVKADTEGRLDWHREIFFPDSVETFGYTVRATSDGGCVLTGHSRAGGEEPDLLLVKVDPEGPEEGDSIE